VEVRFVQLVQVLYFFNMNLLQDILIGLVAGYFALTNFLAHQIMDILPSPAVTEEVSTEAVEEDDIASGLAELPSRFQTIPDILRKSALYQQAAVIGSDGFTEATAEEPIEAIVNIFCTLTNTDVIRTTTGTGFFIDADGVIMTNAHVAQFLLLENSEYYDDAECIVRNGNPATPRYRAELLYLSPAWIQANAGVFNDEIPLGTGERDYALLYVSETMTGEPLPAQFPALSFDSNLLRTSIKGETVLAAGYPADTLLLSGPDADLLPRQAETTISELYTFGSNYADVFSIRGSEVGAQGASGGPVVNEAGLVIGMIATRGDDATDGIGSLRAITLSHIDRTITEETGLSLSENLGGNLSYRSEVFALTLAPFLLTLLEFEN
jgi:S1-C subfamily serine protease